MRSHSKSYFKRRKIKISLKRYASSYIYTDHFIIYKQVIAPVATRRYAPARMQVRLAADLRPSADGSAVRTRLNCRQPACLQPRAAARLGLGQTDGSRYRLMPPYGGGTKSLKRQNVTRIKTTQRKRFSHLRWWSAAAAATGRSRKSSRAGRSRRSGSTGRARAVDRRQRQMCIRDRPPVDGNATRGGSTSVSGRVRSPHMVKLQAASVPIA